MFYCKYIFEPMFSTILIFSYLFIKLHGSKIPIIQKPYSPITLQISTIKCENCIFNENGFCVKFPKMDKNDKIFYEQTSVLRATDGICGEEALFYQDKNTIYKNT